METKIELAHEIARYDSSIIITTRDEAKFYLLLFISGFNEIY